MDNDDIMYAFSEKELVKLLQMKQADIPDFIKDHIYIAAYEEPKVYEEREDCWNF